jgi:hypothetical protein
MKQLKHTTKLGYIISTVKLPRNIFETMIFDINGNEVFSTRTNSEIAARLLHAKAVDNTP